MSLKIAIAATALLAVTAQANAQQPDASGLFLPTYQGVQAADLDIISSQVFFDGSRFAFTATMNGAIGTTPGAFYVFGLDRGTGASNFGSINNPGVKFDGTVILRPGTGVTALGTSVPDFFYSRGNTITAVVPLSFLPGTGFNPDQFKWSLWTRSATPAGIPSIADFGPDNATSSLTLGPIPDAVFVTPEPASVAMLSVGMLGLLVAARRRSKAA